MSDAWALPVDAITFGKAVATGAFPLSGVVVREGASELGASNRTAFQSHTYAHGANTVALMAATGVLRALPQWHGHIARMGVICAEVMLEIEARTVDESGQKRVCCHGQGLMWGGLFTSTDKEHRTALTNVLKRNCLERGVTPYIVDGGFMVSPVLDVDGDEFREALEILAGCVVDATVEVEQCGDVI